VLDIPIHDNVYDFVVSIGLNEHFFGEDRKKTFTEMYRVTKEGGTCVVIVPNLWGSINTEKFLKERNNTWKFGATKLFNVFELKRMMKECGFKKVNVHGVSYFSGIVRVLPVNIQRRIFKSRAWKVITRFPFNLNINFLINKVFGEEIMAVGEKW
jgi:SAM-dependent methyltransferase